MTGFDLRPMADHEWDEVAALIRVSTNRWYESNGRPPIFTGPAESTRLFCEVYEALDPGMCVIAACRESGRIAGSCFVHPRPTHVSLGIMNVHPDFFGRGVARLLLERVTDLADERGLPARLVSSALNLDSFSLYTRAGFVPRTAYQDMLAPDVSRVPIDPPGHDRIRAATPDDVHAIADLEHELCGIRREHDWRHFIDNAAGIWHTLVSVDAAGAIDGVLGSVRHPGSHMLGPGVMRTEPTAAALIAAQLHHHAGGTPVFLVPCAAADLVAMLYHWGARNCELHFHQCRGPWHEPTGITMPTFMPETA